MVASMSVHTPRGVSLELRQTGLSQHAGRPRGRGVCRQGARYARSVIALDPPWLLMEPGLLRITRLATLWLGHVPR